jgi:hypothetical protein
MLRLQKKRGPERFSSDLRLIEGKSPQQSPSQSGLTQPQRKKTPARSGR